VAIDLYEGVTEMIMRVLTRAVAVTAAAITLTLGVAGPSYAEDQPWNLTPYSANLGTAFYDDNTNSFKVWDTNDNGWIVRLDVWRVGQYDQPHKWCYDFGEKDGLPGEYCEHGWGEDVLLRGKLCQLYSGAEMFCTGIKEFYS
jgi:hypothetical protein